MTQTPDTSLGVTMPGVQPRTFDDGTEVSPDLTPEQKAGGNPARLLDGRVVVVTGGNSGIGAAICDRAAEHGARVVVDFVAHPEATEELETEIEQEGGRAVGVDADVSTVEGLTAIRDAALREFGRIDVWINNAGIETRTSLLDSTEADYDKVMAVNLRSAFFGSQIAAKQFIEQGDGGVIVNISSVHEDWPMPGNTPYCLSKGGMRMLTRNTACELGPHGIRVVGVGPGAVNTPINASTTADPAKMKALDAAIPLGRMAEPREVADLVVFAASPAGAYMTATTVFVDGGIMMGSLGL